MSKAQKSAGELAAAAAPVAKKAATKAAPAKAKGPKLIKVIKDGQVLEVHPTTVDEHVLKGWAVIAGQIVEPHAETQEEIDAELGEDGLKDA